MQIPDFQSLMLPVLQASANGEVRFADVVECLAEQLGLTPEARAELLPSGKQRFSIIVFTGQRLTSRRQVSLKAPGAAISRSRRVVGGSCFTS